MSRSASELQSVVIRWLPLAVAIVGLLLVADLEVQQNYRQSANDPQIQMAEDAAAAISRGDNPQTVVPVQKVDREHSLAPFMVVVDRQQHIVVTNAEYGSDSPLPPTGIFSRADTLGEQRFSWQTAQGQRYATVVVPAADDYVIAARSLKEVEDREDALKVITLVAIAGLLAITFLATLILR